MPFIVRRRNVATGAVQDSPQVATRGQAFDLAWDNLGNMLKNNIRQNHGAWGDDEKPGADGVKFKIIMETRPGRGRGLNLRYDYPTGTPPNNPEGTWETNDIFWRIVQVP